MKQLFALLWVGWATATTLFAQRFELLDGQVLNGPPVGITKDGVSFRDPSNDQNTLKVAWTNLTQNALKELEKNPRAKKLVEPYLEIPLEAKAEKPAIEVKSFERLPAPNPAWGLGKLFNSGLGWFFIILLYSANLYAGYEVGIFRNYSPFLVAGLAAVIPIAAPVLFLCLPTRIPPVEEPTAEEVAAAEAPLTLPSQQRAAAAAAAGQAPAEAAPAAAGLPVYKRGEYTFNKRFFETKLSGFFGMHPSDAAKGLLFEVTSNKGRHLCNRIVNAMPSEIRLQVIEGQTILEVGVPYGEVLEVQVKQAG